MKNKIAGHTPGPWRFEPSHTNIEYIKVVEKREPEPHEGYMRDNDGGWIVTGIAKVLCKSPGKKYDRRDDEGQANAALIAAAPELLAALEMAQKELEAIYNVGRSVIDARPECDWDRLVKADDTALAAIAKAKGEK